MHIPSKHRFGIQVDRKDIGQLLERPTYSRHYSSYYRSTVGAILVYGNYAHTHTRTHSLSSSSHSYVILDIYTFNFLPECGILAKRVMLNLIWSSRWLATIEFE